MADLAELLERVKAATGPDREIDRDLCERLNSEVVRPEWRSGEGWSNPTWGRIAPPEPLTASLDAARALMGRTLPGAAVHLDIAQHWCCADIRSGLDEAVFERNDECVALALLAALLSELITRAASEDVGDYQLKESKP